MATRVDRSKVHIIRLDKESLRERLTSFEKKYKMSSRDFYVKFNRGQLKEHRDFFRWASYYDMAATAGLADVKP